MNIGNAGGRPNLPLTVTTNIELDPWGDLTIEELAELNPLGRSADIERIGLMPQGTVSGRATVMLLLRLPDGRPLVAETTLRLFRMASAALLASPVAELDEP